MATEPSAAAESLAADIKQVPQETGVRERLRAVACEVACALERVNTLSREDLEALGHQTLALAGEGTEHLGFAMVAVSNVFWREQFEAVPTSRRLLLLPKCLRDPVACTGTFDSVGLHCAGCGACEIAGLKAWAEELGYLVIVAEGTSSVIMRVLEGDADAILGVACMDSLEKSFQTVTDLGVPNQALPLLYDGCEDTEAEIALIVELMESTGAAAEEATHSPLPLLRETVSMFEPARLADLLAGQVLEGALFADPLTATDAIVTDWMAEGGKRLRPFVTMAAYAVVTHGAQALEPDADAATLVPDGIRRVALAIEAMHKASLVHDDIEDGDAFRYGRPTLHTTWGIGAAINAGDHLVGMGYGLVAQETAELGGECVADIVAKLSHAHLELCRGQGAELLWQREPRPLRAVDALAIAARKTAPAFEVALYAGLRAAGAEVDEALLHRFSLYLGEAYQALNDLDDWHADADNKVSLGRDVLAGRPTVLRAFASEAGAWDALEEWTGSDDSEQVVARVRAIYTETGAFDKAERLVARLREKALEAADAAEPVALAELMRFLVRTVLRRKQHDG